MSRLRLGKRIINSTPQLVADCGPNCYCGLVLAAVFARSAILVFQSWPLVVFMAYSISLIGNKWQQLEILTAARLTSSRLRIKREAGTTTTTHQRETFSCQQVVRKSSQLERQHYLPHISASLGERRRRNHHNHYNHYSIHRRVRIPFRLLFRFRQTTSWMSEGGMAFTPLSKLTLSNTGWLTFRITSCHSNTTHKVRKVQIEIHALYTRLVISNNKADEIFYSLSIISWRQFEKGVKWSRGRVRGEIGRVV